MSLVAWYRTSRIAGKEKRIDSIFKQLEEKKMHLSKGYWQEIQQNFALDTAHIDKKMAYFSSISIADLSSKIQSLQNLSAKDEKLRTSPVVEFDAYSRDLLSAFKSEQVQSVLNNAIRENRAATASISSGVLTGIALGNRQRGAAAYIAASSMQDSYRAGAHNGSIQRLFSSDIYNVRFVHSSADMNESYRAYTRYAWRLTRFGLDSKTITGRALFSLVYNNGHCRSFPANDSDKYGRAAPAEFINRFGSNAWTPKEAAAHLDEIRKKTDLAGRIFKWQRISFAVSSPKLDWQIVEAK